MNPEQIYSGYTNNTFDQRTLKIKKIAILAIISLVILIAVIVTFQIIHNLNMAHITITTNNTNNTITLAESTITPEKDGDNDGDGIKREPPIILKNNVEVSVDPGIYIATVKNPNGNLTSKVIQAGKKSHIKLIINISVVAQLTPVADVNAMSFVANNSHLYYLDRRLGSLNQLDSNNLLSNISSVKFDRVIWADSSFGVGQDTNGQLYTINNGTVNPISDIPNNQTETSLFAVSPAPNHNIYLVKGLNIFEGSQNSAFKQIFTTQKRPTLISPSSSGLLAIIFNPGDGSHGESPSITIINGNKVMATKTEEAYDAQWSPDGKHLITTTDSNSQIYDDNLNSVAIVPNNNVNNPVWIDNNTILYSVNNNLLEFSINSLQSETIAAAPNGQGIIAIQPSDDHSTVYLAVQSSPGSNNDLIIERYNLNDKNNDSALSGLLSKFPTLQGGRCLLSLTNFTSPTIQIFGGQPSDDCESVAQNYMQQIGAIPNNFSYVATNVPPNEPSY